MSKEIFVTGIEIQFNSDNTAILMTFSDARTGQKRQVAFARRALDALSYIVAEHGKDIVPSSDDPPALHSFTSLPVASVSTVGTLSFAKTPTGAPMVRIECEGEAPSSWLALTQSQIESALHALSGDRSAMH